MLRQMGVDDDTILWRSRVELILNLELKCESRKLERSGIANNDELIFIGLIPFSLPLQI
jgi:hypothetical protein